MFDNLRDSSFYEEGEQNNELYTEPAPQPAVVRRRRRGRFLGMTAQQRFLLSMMFLFMVCVMGVLAMMVLGRMSLF
ncbi:MAG TPA: hypothetical protein VFY26_02955 [Anaerolineales bacterium]|nr:hypothetical protein [Anaerolineales bacterium]